MRRGCERSLVGGHIIGIGFAIGIMCSFLKLGGPS